MTFHSYCTTIETATIDEERITMESTDDNLIMMEEDGEEEAFAVKEPIITKFELELNGSDGKDPADLITNHKRQRVSIKSHQ
jgi:hypothetical protein